MNSLTVILAPEQLAELAEMIAAKITVGPAKELYPESEVAKLLGIRLQTLRNWRCQGKINASTRGKPVLYDPTHIQAARDFITSRDAAI